MKLGQQTLYLFFLLFVSLGHAQSHDSSNVSTTEKYVKRLINDTTDISKPEFLIYPTLGYAPETSWEIGVSSLFVFYAKRDTNNRLCELNALVFYTLQKQYGAFFDHAIYSDKNRWFYLGRLRYQSFPLLYFGIGPNTHPEHLATVYANQFQVKERILHKLSPNFYGGLEIDFQRLSSVNFVLPNEDTIVKPTGYKGSANLGLGFGLLYDDRHNVLNVRKGLFSELVYLHYDKVWKSDYSFSTVISDSRYYRLVNKRDVVAFQLFGQFNFGVIPFNQLALMGGESIMRGYYLGRFRDRNLAAAQAEYRFLPLPLGFSKRIGAAVFGAAGSVFEGFSEIHKSRTVIAGGVGLRFLIFPKKDIYTRFDTAFTNEGYGLYLLIGESF
ncbi:MAG: BamA/TamA family outer membrane protein [Opitutaceae bacterium]|nr:BamA/TamA family outer membrane protein [Cytophagales bacterium]